MSITCKNKSQCKCSITYVLDDVVADELLDGHNQWVLQQVGEDSAVEYMHAAVVAGRRKQRISRVVRNRPQCLVVVPASHTQRSRPTLDIRSSMAHTTHRRVL